MLADDPRVYQNLLGFFGRRGRTSPLEQVNAAAGRLELADQRPIVRSEPVIPIETTEFDSDGLADVRQRVISTWKLVTLDETAA